MTQAESETDLKHYCRLVSLVTSCPQHKSPGLRLMLAGCAGFYLRCCVFSTALSPPAGSRCNGDPEAAWLKKSCNGESSLSSSFSPLSLSLSSSPESNFTGTSKVAHSHPPKSQFHVVWCCQLEAPSPLQSREDAIVQEQPVWIFFFFAGKLESFV